MATITSRNTIETLLENDGMYPGDPQADSIYEYRQSVTGEVMWAVFYDQAHFDLDTSPYVEEYRCLWTRIAGHLAPIGVLEQETQHQ